MNSDEASDLQYNGLIGNIAVSGNVRFTSYFIASGKSGWMAGTSCEMKSGNGMINDDNVSGSMRNIVIDKSIYWFRERIWIQRLNCALNDDVVYTLCCNDITYLNVE